MFTGGRISFWLVDVRDYFTLSNVKLNIQNNCVSTYVQSASIILVLALSIYVLCLQYYGGNCFSKWKCEGEKKEEKNGI